MSGFLSKGSCLPAALGPCLLACRWAVGVFGAGRLCLLPGSWRLLPRPLSALPGLSASSVFWPAWRQAALAAGLVCWWQPGGWRGARHRHRPGVVRVGGRELSLGVGAEGAVGTC